MSLISLGDGSTLTLDFTTGQLDPSLTFTRASNATFINSSGLVQWAAANEFRNTGWVTSTTPTGWNVTFGTGTTTWNNDGTLTMNTGGSSTRPCINANSFTVSQGIAYTFGYTVVSVSGSPQVSSVISSTVAGETFAINGATVGPTTVVQAGDVVSCTFTTTGTTAIPRMGPGVNVGMTNTAMTITRPQMNPGVSLQSYLANSSTTAANNNTPRFDYDPTTLAPKGLLIEGTATSLSRSSQDLTNATYWTLQTAYASTSATGGTAPDGTNTGNLFTEPSTNLQRSIYQSYSSAAGTYTFSVWLKAGSGSTRYMRLVVSSGASDFGYVTINMSTGAVQQAATAVGTATNASATVSGNYTATGWRRYSLTVTLAASINFVFLVPTDLASIDTPTTNYGRVSYLGDGSSFLIWGAQLEAGSGASSYIPTGASQVQRLADSCVMTGTNFSSWFAGATEGVLYAEFERPRSQSGSIGHDHAAVGTPYSSGAGWIVYVTNADFWPTTLLWPTGGPIFPGGFPTSIPLVSKQAARWFGGNDATNFANGLQGTTGAGSGTLTPTMLSIGANSTSGTQADRDFLNACVRRVKFWPVALPNSQIIALTT